MKTIQCRLADCGGIHAIVLSEKSLNQEMVSSEIVYNQATGDIFRKSDFESGGEPCRLMVQSYGKPYFVVNLFGLRVPADRLAFFCIYGYWPVGNIKHIDGNTLNNRRYNLLERKSKHASKDASVSATNEGVLYDKDNGVWIAYDEADLGIIPRKCLTERDALRERDSIRSEAAFVREFEAKHGA